MIQTYVATLSYANCTFLSQLADADLGLHVESDFGEAAKKAVELANSS